MNIQEDAGADVRTGYAWMLIVERHVLLEILCLLVIERQTERFKRRGEHDRICAGLRVIGKIERG